jgi:hypothetical protein
MTDYPGFVFQVMPLPVIFVANLLFGLGGTSKLR